MVAARFMVNPEPTSEKILLDRQSALGDCISRDGDAFLCYIGIFREAVLCLMSIVYRI